MSNLRYTIQVVVPEEALRQTYPSLMKGTFSSATLTGSTSFGRVMLSISYFGSKPDGTPHRRRTTDTYPLDAPGLLALAVRMDLPRRLRGALEDVMADDAEASA